MSKRDESFDCIEVEKWLETFFLDPLTTFLDQYTFRIDIYDTEQEYIVEALLTEFKNPKVSVLLDGCQIGIEIFHENKSTSRSVTFPIPVDHQKVRATFTNGLLEIFISKHQSVLRNKKFVKIEME